MTSHNGMYYGYFMPGVYDYPMNQNAMFTRSAYSWEPIMASSSSSNWSNLPVTNAATYVAGPMGGVINYVSDMENHLALPTSHTLATGVIYTPVQEEVVEEVTSYPHQSLPLQNMNQMQEHYTHAGGYKFGVPSTSFRLALPPRVEVEEWDSEPEETSDSQCNSTVEIIELSGPQTAPEKVIPKQKKRTHKRVYKAKQGYIVEEPTSELSEEEGDAPEEAPKISRT